jgi:hypothetical protein
MEATLLGQRPPPKIPDIAMDNELKPPKPPAKTPARLLVSVQITCVLQKSHCSPLVGSKTNRRIWRRVFKPSTECSG